MTSTSQPWIVLLLGGPSGIGKTTVEAAIGRQFGISWLQVDDLRLALQCSRAMLPERGSEALSFFDDTPGVWSLPPQRLRDALIEVGRVLEPAVEIVVANHVDTEAPVVIEGDGLLPSFIARSEIAQRARDGRVRAVMLIEPGARRLLANMQTRGRGLTGRTEADLRTEARAKWLHGQWLAAEARRHGLPVLEVRPWETLVDRTVAVAAGKGSVETRAGLL